MSEYARMIVTSPRISHVSCFFASSTFSVFPLFIARLNAVIPIDKTANGATKYSNDPDRIWRIVMSAFAPASFDSCPGDVYVKSRSNDVLLGLNVSGI